MKYPELFVSFLCTTLLFSFACAAKADGILASPVESGVYVGLGGSYNWARNKANTAAILDAVSGIPPNGVFTRRIGPYFETAEAFSPEAQIGYLRHIADSNWLWGAEFRYQYSRLNVVAEGAGNPRTYLTLSNPAANTTDRVTSSSVSFHVRDELILPVFAGYSFSRGFIYLGAGPSLFRTQRTIGSISDTSSALYIGNAEGFSASNWVWGGAVQAGIAWHVNPAWFVKLDYTWAASGKFTTGYQTAFSPAVNGGLNTGTFSFNTSQRLTEQGVALSINKLFSL